MNRRVPVLEHHAATVQQVTFVTRRLFEHVASFPVSVTDGKYLSTTPRRDGSTSCLFAHHMMHYSRPFCLRPVVRVQRSAHFHCMARWTQPALLLFKV